MFRFSTATASGGLTFALRCADTVLRGIDRRRAEAWAVAAWLDEYRGRLGLSEGEDFCPGKENRAPLPAVSWRRVHGTITRLLRAAPPDADTTADRWAKVLGHQLELTGLDRHLLGLAMIYGADESVQNLVDAISHARGRDRNLCADPALLALLLNQQPHEVEASLLSSGRLLGCGLLEVGDCSSLRVHAQVARLVRRATPPGHDPLEQLLGPALPAALPLDAFAHIGPQADIAAALLQTALRQREPGINILLYGPPGTGKTSFAATLAAQVSARLRAVRPYARPASPRATHGPSR